MTEPTWGWSSCTVKFRVGNDDRPQAELVVANWLRERFHDGEMPDLIEGFEIVGPEQ